MDERTKETVRVLLDRHPRGCVAERMDFALTNTAAGLYRLLVVALLTDDSVPSDTVVNAVTGLFSRRWDSAPEMAQVDDEARAEVLAAAGLPKPQDAARTLGAATRYVLDTYDGDLQRLRAAAGGDGDRLRGLLDDIPGMHATGRVVFLREAQMFWPEAGPAMDDRATRAARRLDLPHTSGELLEDVARGSGYERLSWITGALAQVDAMDEYDDVRKRVERRTA